MAGSLERCRASGRLAGEREADDRRGGQRERRRAPDPARAVDGHQRAGDDHPDPGARQVRAHQDRERAAAQLVRRAALHEQRVADDRGSVADAADDAADGGHPDVRRSPRDADPTAISAERDAVDAREPIRSTTARHEAADARPAPTAPYIRP